MIIDLMIKNILQWKHTLADSSVILSAGVPRPVEASLREDVRWLLVCIGVDMSDVLPLALPNRVCELDSLATNIQDPELQAMVIDKEAWLNAK